MLGLFVVDLDPEAVEIVPKIVAIDLGAVIKIVPCLPELEAVRRITAVQLPEVLPLGGTTQPCLAVGDRTVPTHGE